MRLARSICAPGALDDQLLTPLQGLRFFIGEWRASNLHPSNFGSGNKLGDIGDSKVLSLNRWEELFESTRTAWGDDHC